MVQVVTPRGETVDIRDESISRIVEFTPIFPYTHIWLGPRDPAVETVEPAANIIRRLVLATPLAVLTNPRGDPVWIKGSAVTAIRDATPFERTPLPPQRGHPRTVINTIVTAAGHSQPVQELRAQARTIINAAGGNIT